MMMATLTDATAKKVRCDEQQVVVKPLNDSFVSPSSAQYWPRSSQ